MNYSHPRLSYPHVLIAIFIHVMSTGADVIEFDYQLLKMKPEVADFLEKRLVDGGAPALEVGEKLPQLISSGTISSLVAHKFSAKNMTRNKSRSSKKDFNQPGGDRLPDDDYSVPEDFAIEIDPALGNNGIVSLSQALTYAVKESWEELIKSVKH